MHELPEDVQRTLESVAGCSDFLIRVESDLDRNGTLGKQWLAVSDEKLFVVSMNGKGPEVNFDIPISDIASIEAESLVGNGCVVANVRGEFIPLIRYSNALSREFGRATRIVQALAKSEEIPPESEDDRTKRCEKCGLPMDSASNVCPNCVNKAQAIRRLMQYVKPYWKLTALSGALMLAAQALMTAPPYLTKVVVDDILRKAETANGALSAGLRGELIASLGLIVAALIGTRLISTGFNILESRVNARLGSQIVHDIRVQLYGALQRLTVSFYDKRQTGTVISRISQDTSSLQQFLAHDVQFMLSNTLILALVLVIMFSQNWQLAALTVIPAPIASIAATIIFKRLRWMHMLVWRRWGKLHGIMSDSLQGMRVVKAFAQENREINKFEYRSGQLFTAAKTAEETWGTLLPILWFFLTAGQFIVWYVGGIGVIDLKVSTGTLVMFIGYTGMLYGPLQIVTRLWDWVGRCLVSSERVFEYIDSQREEDDSEEKIRMPDIKGHVEFRNVTFGYDKNRPVLHNIDLDVAQGEMIGLVGHSGAGKSTIINLLTRFYSAQEGTILIDGVDIRRIKLEDLRKQIGIVPQEPFLFSGTIADNIAYSKPDATPEEIMRAAKAANAHDFIINFPDGYETQVGERGMSISGGERQRISIARAILDDPKILILDEATSSVDSKTERQIQEALARLVQNRTTFAIAHRLSTLNNADRLLVLDKGKIAELGTHRELMDKDGVYANLVKMQNETSNVMAVGG